MVETEITNILEDYIDNDEDYFKVVDFIENQDKMLYAKNNTNKILINEKKALQQRIHDIDKISCDRAYRITKAIEYIENNDLYTQDIDYDYDENMVLLPPSDELERQELLDILRGKDE